MTMLPVGFGAGVGGGAGYQIEKSLRFRASASAYLNRTPGTAGDRRTWTWSAWVKRGALGASGPRLLSVTNASTYDTAFFFTAGDALRIFSALGLDLTTTAVFRDPSAHFHLLVHIDTTQATASDRAKVWVNGVQLTSFSSATYSPQNTQLDVNATVIHEIGRFPSGGATQFDGYLSEINLIDGQALDPSAFGEFDSTTGVWVPKQYTGTYGTNGFYLPFDNGTSLSTLTEDRSGNGNNWTATNISLTAGATYDWMDDTPTNNFAVLNPIRALQGTGGTFSNANLRLAAANDLVYLSTIPMPSTGKWYAEIIVDGVGSALLFGIRNYAPSSSLSIAYRNSGNRDINGTQTAFGATYTVNDNIGVAVDCDAQQVSFYKNNVLQGTLNFSLAGITADNVVFAGYLFGAGAAATFNFGQRPFAYTPPTGFLPLCTKNLPPPAIASPADHFDVVLGTGANIKTTAEGLYTDQLVWIKDRANTNNHQLIDSVRGTSAVLQSNTTAAETTYTAPSGTSVGWVWKADGTGATNTDGSITSTVSANTTAGFSIVLYQGNGVNSTVGHGLGVAPGVVIVKRRDNTGSWPTQFPGISASNTLFLNSTDGSAAATTIWNSTKPTSTVFSVGTGTSNSNTGDYVAYCFAEIEGFSKIGTYVGNANADGPFVYCGFRPKWLMVKQVSASGNRWFIFDSVRNTFNVIGTYLNADANFADATFGSGGLDLAANGFKLRTNSAAINTSASTYVFMAFAESPFNYARAR